MIMTFYQWLNVEYCIVKRVYKTMTITEKQKLRNEYNEYLLKNGYEKSEKITRRNQDDMTEAVRGLDIFTKNWCMDCERTEKYGTLVFRCLECNFNTFPESGQCEIKKFATSHDHGYPMNKFGAMRH